MKKICGTMKGVRKPKNHEKGPAGGRRGGKKYPKIMFLGKRLKKNSVGGGKGEGRASHYKGGPEGLKQWRKKKENFREKN